MKTRYGLPLLAAGAACTLACSTPRRPYQAVEEADAAVRRADVGGEAAQHAPLELRLAREKLDEARGKLRDEQYTDARRLAEQALADVELAEARAQSQVARDTARDMREALQTIQSEAVRGVGVAP